MIKVLRIAENYIDSMVYDSRVASIRWDVVPRGFVLDLDMYDIEAADHSAHRAWLVFEEIREIFLPFNHLCLPNGFWIDGIETGKQEGQFKAFTIGADLPVFDAGGEALYPAPQFIKITAQKAFGLISRERAKPDEYGALGYDIRKALASDTDFRDHISLWEPGT